jgi:hypothetical protein
MTMLVIILELALAGIQTVGNPALQGAAAGEPLCKMLGRASEVDRSVVIVEGVYIRTIHGTVLTAPGCAAIPRATVNLRLAEGFHQQDHVMKALWSLTRGRKAVVVVVQGSFHVAGKDQGFGPGVEPYEIEVTKFLSAETYADQNPKQP